MNALTFLLEKYPNKNWDYNGLSKNPNISFNYIKNNLYDNTNVNFYKEWGWYWISRRVTYEEFINNQNLPWDNRGLSENQNIPFEYIKNNLYDNRNVNLYDDTNVNLGKNLNLFAISKRVTYEEFINNQDLPWDYDYLSINENIPIEYIKNNLDKHWEWRSISFRVTYEEFINNPELPWDYLYLYSNINISFEYIKNNLYDDRNVNLDKNLNLFSISYRVTYEEFINNPELPWNYNGLSKNPNIPIDYIKKNVDKKWFWFYISNRIIYKDIINNPELPWDYDELSKNKNIPIDHFINNLDKVFDWCEISERVQYEDVINNPNLPWNYYHLSSNKNIPIEYIKNNLNKYWLWYYITQRVTYKEVIDNPDLPWDFRGLSWNTFDYESLILAKKIMNIIINDEKYIAKVYNPNRMRSYKSICELEELKTEFGWTDEEFNKYVK